MNMRLILGALALALTSLAATASDQFVNLTPKPMEISVGSGRWVLPKTLTVGIGALPDSLVAEVERFVADFNRATGWAASTTAAPDADIAVTVNPELGPEAYTLSVTPEGAQIGASTSAGLFYAFRSIEKMLPPNVLAGKTDATVSEYSLPVVEIIDSPRFGYRGFMLDVSRHFFTIDEVKRMIDLMSYYKLNRFHWHLTDDQGWRIEMPEYPKLTTIGATAPNSRFTDMNSKRQYWINRPYGPYFYTQDELRDVVAYARERHIEVVPEVDMPGHFCAAMTAYPEFSCTPDGEHRVWSDGGISTDVLNVANPAAVKFAKDVLTTLMDIFPYQSIHIGGDECPTVAWENNAECEAMKDSLGLSGFRQLQSHFISEMNDHVRSHGRTLSLWDESISAKGADTGLVKDTDAIIYCWTVGTADAAAKLGTGLGLRCIYTPWGPYYINRIQDADDAPGAGGNGGVYDHVKRTYETVPFRTVDPADAEYCYGVQGTFWTEHVSDREYMEFLALPRLIAIAEAGWTPQAERDFDDFIVRVKADIPLLRLNDYKFAPHFLAE